jgi:hypothetical protein
MVSEFTTLQNYRETKFKIKNVLHKLPIINLIGIACINSKKIRHISNTLTYNKQ